MCRTSVGPGGSQLSLNPINWRQMCVLGTERLTLYLLEQCDNDQLLLTPQSVFVRVEYVMCIHHVILCCFPRETTLPESGTRVGTSLQPPQLSLSATQTYSKASEMELNHATSDHTRLPDLTNVLFKETYDEYTRNRDPVVLTSHCWSSQQTLYVGCRGGQLLMVDFDTGVIQVLANTQLTQVFYHV